MFVLGEKSVYYYKYTQYFAFHLHNVFVCMFWRKNLFITINTYSVCAFFIFMFFACMFWKKILFIIINAHYVFLNLYKVFVRIFWRNFEWKSA